MEKEKVRSYDQWAGNLDGVPEDKIRCIEEVFSMFKNHQCLRKRGFGEKGLFCKQHAKMNEEHKSWML